jgi:hypothetical protein
MDRALKVRDLDVWRAAEQIVNHYPDAPVVAACQQADAAWDAGDMANFQIRMRIAKAVLELIRTKPHLRTAIN